MSLISQVLLSSLQNVKRGFPTPLLFAGKNLVIVRGKAKKAITTTQNRGGNCRPAKHRGWKASDGETVPSGKLLVTQLATRFHPGLHVGFGKNGTLWAMEPGKVVVTCEKANLNWDHSWIQRCYSGREGQTIYKKYFNIIPDKQHDRFKLIDAI